MKSKLPVASAKQINEQHRLAIQCAENAIEHAILCGQMLVDRKSSLAHGEFLPWIEKNCDFAISTATRYMKAARSSEAVNLSSLRHIFPSAKPKEYGNSDKVQIPTAVVICEKTAAEKAPFLPPKEPDSPPQKPKPEGGVSTVILGMLEDDASDPERPDDIDEDAALAAAEADYSRRIAKVMEADDKLAEANAQLKQQSALIAALERARDGYMYGKEQITKMLEAEQRKSARLEKELQRLRKEAA